jgi:Mg2+-importing ATPase
LRLFAARRAWFVPLPAVYWLWIAGFLVMYCVMTHLVKSWFFRKFGVD